MGVGPIEIASALYVFGSEGISIVVVPDVTVSVPASRPVRPVPSGCVLDGTGLCI